MRVLLTGASSFTGLWFAETLHRNGYEIVAPLPRTQQTYEGIRAHRVEKLAKVAEIVWSCAFGSDQFLEVTRQGPWDYLCHHGAQVSNYRSLDFDVAGSLAANTLNLPLVLSRMLQHGLKAVVLTGSVFEQNEGAGDPPLHAFSPYGLSKGLTAEVFRFWCGYHKIPLTKFVIPNPFGPWEEPRFCNYLMQCWQSKKPATIKTPIYVRDNIHVSLLALCYADAVSRAAKGDFSRFNPSGYIETQGGFAQRFAHEIGTRLKMDCPIELVTQTEFPEPRIRTNTEQPDIARLGWNEKTAWDDLGAYYQSARELGLS